MYVVQTERIPAGWGSLLNLGSDGAQTSGLGQGSVVEVKIFLTPSGKILYDKLINVE